ncbi:DUF4179 domain-containing protein [Cohnella cholangitidis]|uniref:DUF4179 domain-containing protein n=1 Tax=Cohnella cholangitidis TaxID=2598458 RepID=A0A7G5C3A7_9BACL|nr:DUF4179 domain-containing protein [Cohnella cholangitidis]QMV43691.1 DUF4179 domain-containing protein [Cohnella cholangitidis]
MSSNELDALLRNERPAMPSNMPWSVAQRMEETLQALPTRDALKRGTQRIRRLAVAVASIAVIGGAVASYVLFAKDQPSEIAKLPPDSTVEQRSEFIRTPVLGSLIHDANMEKNGPAVTDQGITLMVRDVTYDGSEMAIRYSVQSDKEIDGYMMDAILAMDSRDIGKVGYISSSENYEQLQHRYEKLDSDQYEGAINSWKLAYSDYRPESFNLKLEVTRIGNQAGNWSLNIPVSKTPDMTVVTSDLMKTTDEGTLELNRIVLSRISSQVEYRFEGGGKNKSSWFGVEVTDDKGIHYGSHIADNVTSLGYMDLGPVASGTQALIIRPFYEDFRNSKKIEVKDLFHTPMLKQPTEDEPLVLPLGEGREMYVTGLEYLADKTIVHSKSTSVSGGFAIQDENGKLLPVLSFGSDGSVEFKPIPEDAKLTFLTRPTYPRTYIPELELRVDLPQR